MTHAQVQRDGFTVPLIGIPKYATLEQCDCCHEWGSIRHIKFNGLQFLCLQCRAGITLQLETSAREGGWK